nr:hypothetical protein [Mycoplasmopsis bovis]
MLSFASSFILILVNGIVVDILFPKYKMVKIEAYTSKPEEILDRIFALKDKRFSVTIADFTGGYSWSITQHSVHNYKHNSILEIPSFRHYKNY